MADQSTTSSSGPNGYDALLAERMKMWNGFTGATTGVVIFMVVLLSALAFFLL